MLVYQKTVHRLLICGCLLMAQASLAIDISNSPPLVSSYDDPNIMLLLDSSGSMRNIVPPTAPTYDPDDDDISCPVSNQLVMTATQTADIRISSAGARTIRLFTNDSRGTLINTVTWGTTGSNICFVDDNLYNFRLNANAGTNTKYTSGYTDAEYTGHFLNWYFGDGTSWNLNDRFHPNTQTRLTVAQNAAVDLIDDIDNARVGLATYNSHRGARIRVAVADNSDAQRNLLTNKLAAINASGFTPLAEALHQIGRYFIGIGNNQTLTLHPGGSYGYPSSNIGASSLFPNNPAFDSGVPTGSPIETACQKNFSVVLTDGRATQDRNIPAALRDYDGDCQNNPTPACTAGSDMKDGQVYEANTRNPSDYLDDVAAALYDMDLRPELDNEDGSAVKNNISTYVIGFADESVQDDPMITSTAVNGGSITPYSARNASQLAAALRSILISIQARTSATAAYTASSGVWSSASKLFQASFNSGDWHGELHATPINADGSLGTPQPFGIPPAGVRSIFSVNSTTGNGIAFQWAALSIAQRANLGNATLGPKILNYVRGDRSNETPNGEDFRARNGVLGDIVNSSPIFVQIPALNYPAGLEAASYPDFQLDQAQRAGMVYVGANDGLLHAFNVDSGMEQFAFVPSEVFPRLAQYSHINYVEDHQFYVDGTPTMGDAFFGNAWHTLLVGGLNKGGHAIYALDITNPTSFDASNVLWEFNRTNNGSRNHGHAGMGYSFSRPAIVKLPNASQRWAAVFGNGYNSAAGTAVLYLVDAATGGDSLLRVVDTGIGNSTNPNGLSTVAPVDLDYDNRIDLIYAGDLYGNLWRFKPGGGSNWSGTIVFSACSTSPCTANNRQPITIRPTIGRGINNHGVMIYFGTGVYLDTAHASDTSTQSFFAVWDTGDQANLTRANLTPRGSFSANDTNDYRTSAVYSGIDDYTHGWSIDFTDGERIIHNPILWDDRLIFTTLIPQTGCSSGGTGWLMEVDSLTGGALPFSPFDVNDDGLTDINDLINDQTASGKRMGNAIAPPAVVEFGQEGTCKQVKYAAASDGSTETIHEPCGSTGRQSWLQLR